MARGILAGGGSADKDAARRHRELGRSAYERGDLAVALASLREAVRADPRSLWTWLFTAQAHLGLGDREASYAAIRRALDIRPDEPNAVWHLAQLLEEDGRRVECRALVTRLCAAHPRDPGVLQRASQTLVRLGDPAAARALASGIGVSSPGDAEALAAVAAGLDAAGASEEARQLLESIRPGSPQSAVAAAAFLWWQGQPRKAWDALRSLPPGDIGSSLLVKLGRALRARGQLEAARDAYTAAATLDPEQGRARHWAETTQGEWVLATGRWHATPSAVGPIEGVPGRVLHLVTRSRPYAQVGYSIRTHYVAMGQQEVGLEPHVVTQYGFPLTIDVAGAPHAQVIDGVPYHHPLPPDGRLPSRPDERLSAGLERLAGVVRELRPAVLHAASDYQNGLLALRLGELARLPVVYEVRGFWEESWLASSDRDPDSDIYRWRQERDTECMRRADAVVTLSEGMAEEVVARGIERSKITLVPNGVDVDRFVPVGRDEDIARRLGMAPDDVTVGYISTLTPYEGIAYLLEAAALLIRRDLPVRVLLVGEGVSLGHLQQQAQDLGIRDRVAFTGRVPHEEVLAYYGSIDIFVVPRIDARVAHLVTPLKPLEAMATGRALVVSGVDALRRMVREGVTAEVFRPEDAAHLAEILEGLVRDPERRTRLGAAARAWVVENRSWSQLAKAYLDVYRRLGALDLLEAASPARELPS